MSPHGTVSRYTNGRCRCSECRAAMRMYRAARPDIRAKGNAQKARRQRALTRLGARHPEEYMQLLAEEPL